MAPKDFITIRSFSAAEIRQLIDLAVDIKRIPSTILKIERQGSRHDLREAVLAHPRYVRRRIHQLADSPFIFRRPKSAWASGVGRGCRAKPGAHGAGDHGPHFQPPVVEELGFMPASRHQRTDRLQPAVPGDADYLTLLEVKHRLSGLSSPMSGMATTWPFP